MSTGQVKKGSKTRDKILESSVKLFAEKGFSGTTTKEIAGKAGVNEALVFRYFSTKRDLYHAIIERKIKEEPEAESLLKPFRETRDDWLFLKSIAIRTLEWIEKDPSFIRLLYFSAFEGDELSEIFFESYVQHQRMLLSDYIEQRISEGAFKNVNPLLAIRAFTGMVANYAIEEKVFGKKKSGEVEYGEVVETFIKIFLDGIKIFKK
ncbi:MAG: TetR/AcrR family transcriptional regulator [Ignavibacteriales bacterium]